MAKVDELTAPAVLNIWARTTGLANQTLLAERLYLLLVDSFFLRLTPSTFDEAWLRAYFWEVRQLVVSLQRLHRPAVSQTST